MEELSRTGISSGLANNHIRKSSGIIFLSNKVLLMYYFISSINKTAYDLNHYILIPISQMFSVTQTDCSASKLDILVIHCCITSYSKT